MNNLNIYIIEKLHLGKNTSINLDNKDWWLKRCEKIIFDYLDKKLSHNIYDGEYEISYYDNKLHIIFDRPIAYSVISNLGSGIYKKLNLEGLINPKKREDIFFKDNKKTIVFYE